MLKRLISSDKNRHEKKNKMDRTIPSRGDFYPRKLAALIHVLVILTNPQTAQMHTECGHKCDSAHLIVLYINLSMYTYTIYEPISNTI